MSIRRGSGTILIRTCVEWDIDGERRAAIGQTVHADASAMRFGDGANLRKTQAPSALAAHFCLTQSLKCTEERCLFFRWNVRAVIVHPHNSSPVCLVDGDRDRT